MKTRVIVRSGRRAFTFIEIMLVVLIIGVLMAVVVPRMTGQGKKARVRATGASIHALQTSLQSFELNADRFPTTEEGLQALVERPSGLNEDQWDGPYLDKKPKDAWGEEFVYRSPGENNRDYDVISKGPDKQENTDDDISNAPKEEASGS